MEKDSSKFTNAFNRFEEWRNNVGKTASGKIGEELNLGSDTEKRCYDRYREIEYLISRIIIF